MFLLLLISSAKVYPFFGMTKDFLLKFLKISQKVIYNKTKGCPIGYPFCCRITCVAILLSASTRRLSTFRPYRPYRGCRRASGVRVP